MGRLFESLATGGHPHGVAWGLKVLAWPVLVVMAVLVRPRSG